MKRLTTPRATTLLCYLLFIFAAFGYFLLFTGEFCPDIAPYVGNDPLGIR